MIVRVIALAASVCAAVYFKKKKNNLSTLFIVLAVVFVLSIFGHIANSVETPTEPEKTTKKFDVVEENIDDVRKFYNGNDSILIKAYARTIFILRSYTRGVTPEITKVADDNDNSFTVTYLWHTSEGNPTEEQLQVIYDKQTGEIDDHHFLPPKRL